MTEGLTGGMTWRYATYFGTLPPADDPARKQAEEEMKRRLARGGVDAAHFRNLADYDFVIGLALSSSVGGDALRIVMDELSHGRWTEKWMQEEYEKLRGRSFEKLDCHSNGAMICLAAFTKGDIEAKSVRLLGPQVTADTLREWNKLLREHKGGIERLEIVMNDRDPVPYIAVNGAAVAGSEIPRVLQQGTSAVRVPPRFFDSDAMKSYVAFYAPDADLAILPCPREGPLLEQESAFYCHDINRYRRPKATN
jgi:hypothetical protein